MEHWAIEYSGKCNFVCIGCAGPQLAEAMGTRMKLSACTNAFIAEQSEMPRWGQLGCNGFIVFSAGSQHVICPSTSPFMQVRDLAFRHVVALVDSMVDGQPVPTVCPGQYVRLTGLQKTPELNGQTAVCLEAADDAAERCHVQLLQQRRNLRVKPANLILIEGDEMDSEEEYDEEEGECDEEKEEQQGS